MSEQTERKPLIFEAVEEPDHVREKTRIVKGYTGADEYTGSLSFPLYQGVTFAHPALGETTMGFAYARADSPTRQELERTMALLEHGARAFATSSGMAAISLVLKLFRSGDHILVSEDLYGGTYRLFTSVYGQYGLSFDYIDTSDLELIKKSIRPNTKAIFVETPSNPMMRVADLQAISVIAKESGAYLIVDNTFLTPYYQKPLDLGADIVVHSATKYLGGHNDILAGFVVIKDAAMIERLFILFMAEGQTLGAYESWLLLRSIKTLAVRLDKQQENALLLTQYLKQRSDVEKVWYVGDKEHPAYELSKRQTSGFGAMISFTLKDASRAEEILKKFKVITFAESLGGVDSLITYPMIQTHGDIPAEMRERIGVNEKLLRLSVGIEDIDDLLEDIGQALE